MKTINTYSAFQNQEILALGSLEEVLKSVKGFLQNGGSEPVLIFDHATGKQWDFDFQGTLDEVLERSLGGPEKLGPGRPKLGIVSREVTLLPRHWEWLEAQPGKASGTLRRLVEEAMKVGIYSERHKIEALGRILTAVAGNLPEFEEVLRALYKSEWEKVEELTENWPQGIRGFLRNWS